MSKYLGMLETDTIKQEKMKEKINKSNSGGLESNS